ncbi:MAG: tRNA (adenosine(37)-N6)-dimethylallyltransferase MiaA [Ardenticatenales bacterium]
MADDSRDPARPGAPAIAIVGPTAVGKTEVSIALATALDGEIVSLDSRLLYRGMDIGTAKPSAAERAEAVHHLIDVADAADVLSLADVLERARAVLSEIRGRGRRPVLVGGTGQYVRALREGWAVPPVPPNEALRAALFALAGVGGAMGASSASDSAAPSGAANAVPPEGVAALHARLRAVDPASAERLHPNNVRRIVRAIEVYEATGRPLSSWQSERTSAEPLVVVGLARADDVLEARIDARIDRMIADGLEDEVRALVERGVGFDHPNMSGVGYAEWRERVLGDASVASVAERLRASTRRLVRKQALWFRRDDPTIRWVDIGSDESAAAVVRRVQAACTGGRR